MRPGPDSGWRASEDGSEYYVSITDMIIGLLFLFIILLMYFAFQMRDSTREQVVAESVRNELIRNVAADLAAVGVETRADFGRGTLSLPNGLLFEAGSDALSAEGRKAMSQLADALAGRLPCFADREGHPPPPDCGAARAQLDAILLEGHTDSDRVSPTARIRDNWDLSTARASTTLRALLAERADLLEYRVTPPGSPLPSSLFSIAGYADQRPAAIGNDEAAKAANRRIDVRFIMALPKPPELKVDGEGVDRPETLGAPIRPGQRLRFDLRNNAAGYLREGWGYQESWGVWSIGNASRLVVPMRNLSAGQAYEIEFDLVANVTAESPERVVRVALDDGPFETWQFVAPKNTYRMTIAIPASRPPEAPLTLRFEIPDPVSPLQLGQSDDARLLGVGLRSLVVRKAR